MLPNPICILLPTEELATKLEHTHGKELLEPKLEPIVCCPPVGVQLTKGPPHSDIPFPLHEQLLAKKQARLSI